MILKYEPAKILYIIHSREAGCCVMLAQMCGLLSGLENERWFEILLNAPHSSIVTKLTNKCAKKTQKEAIIVNMLGTCFEVKGLMTT